MHVVMYWYYFLCAMKRPPRWKRLITNLQIVQFVYRYDLLRTLPPERTCVHIGGVRRGLKMFTKACDRIWASLCLIS